VLTVLLTSPRVAPGLLTWQAWASVREASRVLAGSAGHPQIPALTASGVIPEIVDAPAEPGLLAEFLSGVVVAAEGPVAWLAPAGESADPAMLSALTVPVSVLHGSHDVPGSRFLDLVPIMDRLRVSCPWDRQQTHESLVPYLLEEAYEAVETVETGDFGSLREELGDVLLQVLFHSRIAAERSLADGGFTVDDVADTLAAKLIRRHPHVFGSVSVSSADDVSANWEEIKKAEKAERLAAASSGSGGPGAAGGSGAAGEAPSVLDGVAFGQPALSLAAQLQRRAERAGAPMPFGDLAEGSSPGSPAGVLGEELMRVVARARAAGIDPELELRAAARRYAERVRQWERSR
jgi:XTP/dITP diphosphohydrolase